MTLRDRLEDMGMKPGELAALLAHLGDSASMPTIRQRVRRWMTGQVALPGEMLALLALLRHVRTGASMVTLDRTTRRKPAGKPKAQRVTGG